MPSNTIKRLLFTSVGWLLLQMGSWAQDSLLHAPVHINLQNVQLRQAIDSLSSQLQVGFAFDADALPLDSMITLRSTDIPLKKLLYTLLSQHDVDVSCFMGQIVISHAERQEVVPSDLIRMSGTIADATSEEPLPYVNICIPNQPLGTTTNQAGEFEFIVPRKYAGQTLAFSSIGYNNADLIIPENDTTLTINLFQSDIELPEVKVMAIPAQVIINRMMENRRQNYFQSDVMLDVFFRESIQQDTQYVEVSEAVIDIMKPSYSSNYQFEKVRFVKGRKSSEVSPMNQFKFRLQGGPYYFSRMDVARYLDFLPDKDIPDIYHYAFAGYDYQYGRTLYKIAFAPINDNGDLLYEGEFYIDADQYALVAVDFRMTKQTLRQSRKYLIRKDTRNAKATPYFAIYHIDYRPFQNQWVLNRVKGQIKVRIKDRSQHLSADFEAVSEMLITNFRPTDGDRLKNAETFKPDYVLSEQIDSFDPDFWKNYNVIQPNEDLSRIIKQNISNSNGR